jgi:CO dehydrogenase/acetyl-CoA synthase beta subunit
MAEITDEFRNKMTEWVELKNQLTEARKDMKVLNTREKELNLYIKGYMKANQIDNVNLRQGKVSYKKTKKKETFTRKIVSKGLHKYCRENDSEVEKAMECITSVLEVTEKDSITLTGLKKKDE